MTTAKPDVDELAHLDFDAELPCEWGDVYIVLGRVVAQRPCRRVATWLLTGTCAIGHDVRTLICDTCLADLALNEVHCSSNCHEAFRVDHCERIR